MSGKHTFKIAGAREFDKVPSLVYVNTIVTVEQAMGGKSARTKVISGDLSVDKADELFRGSRGSACNGVIINLATEDDKATVDGTTIEVEFMNRVDKTKFINEEGSDETLKAESGFGMPLKCAAKGKDMLRRVQASTMAFVIPGHIGCINSNVTRLGGRGRLLKGIGGIAKRDKEVVLCSLSKEELHTRLLNTRGIVRAPSRSQPAARGEPSMEQ